MTMVIPHQSHVLGIQFKHKLTSILQDVGWCTINQSLRGCAIFSRLLIYIDWPPRSPTVTDCLSRSYIPCCQTVPDHYGQARSFHTCASWWYLSVLYFSLYWSRCLELEKYRNFHTIGMTQTKLSLRCHDRLFIEPHQSYAALDLILNRGSI